MKAECFLLASLRLHFISFHFLDSGLFNELRPTLVTGADSRANHYHSELIRRRRVGKRLFPLVLAIAALSIVRVRAREFASVTAFLQPGRRQSSLPTGRPLRPSDRSTNPSVWGG